MELLTPEILQPLGVSAVLAIFLFLAWRRLEQREQEHAAERKEQNEYIRAVTADLAKKYEENTKMTEGVKYSLDKNTDTMEKVLDRFDDTIRGRNNGNHT